MRRARSFAAGLVVLVVAAGCEEQDGIPREDLGVEVHAPLGGVVPGKAFELTLVRRWHRRFGDLATDGAWEKAFAPLVVRLAHVERREDAERVEETRLFHAYAMSRTDVVVPSIAWRPKLAGDLTASTPRLTVRVRPDVDAADPGSPEVGAGPAAPSAPDRSWIGVAALAALLASLSVWRLRRRARPAPPAPPPAVPGPDADLLALAALPEASTADFVAAAATLVRAALGRRAGVTGAARTNEETLARAAGLPAPAMKALERLLARSEALQYARAEAHAGDVASAREDARMVLAAGTHGAGA